MYHSVCGMEGNSSQHYIVDGVRWLNESIKDHNGRDHNFHLFKHSISSGHDPVPKSKLLKGIITYEKNSRKTTDAETETFLKPKHS